MGLLNHNKKNNKQSEVVNQQTDWKLTDMIVKVKDIVEGVRVEQYMADFKDKYEISSGEFTCVRDMIDTCLYFTPEGFHKFKRFEAIYDQEAKLINLSKFFQLTVIRDSMASVSHKIVPQSVIIKQFRICMLDRETKVYVMRKIELGQTEQLFEDLVKLQTFKDRFGLE